MPSAADEDIAFDSHGEVDILSEEGTWQNLKLKQLRRRHAIEGISLNALLLGHFTLYGTQKDALNAVPGGGMSCWEETLEPFFICMRQIATTDCVMRRVRALALRYHLHRSSSSSSSSPGCTTAINSNSLNCPAYYDGDTIDTLQVVRFPELCSLLYGALSFCIYWIYCFRSFLTDADLARLKVTIYQLQPHISPAAGDREAPPGSVMFIACARIHSRYQELLATAADTLDLRMMQSLGLDIDQRKNHLFHCTGENPQQLLNFAASRSAAPAAPAMLPASSSMHSPTLEVDVPAAVGSWTGHEIMKQREQLKAALTQGPQIKLEIFGGDALLDDIDDDDDDDEDDYTGGGGGGCGGGAFSGNSDGGDDDNAVTRTPAPVPRIPPGSSLLLNPLAVGNSLLEIDALELARQWTLADHAFFCSIPLHSLVPMMTAAAGGSGALKKQKPVTELARYQQLRRGAQACGARGGARGFIDRFNALSNWVTFTVLSGDTPEARAARMGTFIRIAGQLMELNNFNGLMVILTALQQGSISRLRRSWEAVGKAEMLKLAQMQKLMAAGKNYQFYRQELVNLSIHFNLDAEPSQSGSCADVKSIYHRSEMMWKTNIHLCNHHSSGESFGADAVGDDGFSAAAPRRPSTFTNEDKFEALVPHLGAHLAELTSIQEGNSDFLSDRCYLYNVHKFVLLGNTLSLLQKIQRLRYNLTPVRLIVAALNNIAKQHLRQSGAAASAYSKELYAMSEAAESAADAHQYAQQQHRQQDQLQQRHRVQGAKANALDTTLSRDAVGDSMSATAADFAGTTGIGSESGGPKRVRTAAYERIMQRRSTSEQQIESRTASPAGSSGTSSPSRKARSTVSTVSAASPSPSAAAATATAAAAPRRRMTVLDANNKNEAHVNAETEEEDEVDEEEDDESSVSKSSNSSSSSDRNGGSSEVTSTNGNRKGLFARSAKLVRKLTWGFGVRHRSAKDDADDD